MSSGVEPVREAERRARDSAAIERSIAIVCRNLVRESSALLSLGRFELIRTLGRGGNGVVYEVFDPQRAETVALKVLYERGPSYLYRLKREFRSLSGLRHPNLVALHELSVADDDPYFTMELVRGADLLTHLRAALGRESPDYARVRDVLAQFSDGIHALHRAAKLHRDIKPSNVLVTDAERVVLLDFGLVDDVGARTSAAEGTPAYMAPEQARGAACEASDWYSVGRVLQQALTASGRTALDCPEHSSLAALAARLLEAEPRDRPNFSEIVSVLRGSSPSARPHPPRAVGPSKIVGRDRELAQLRKAFRRSREEPVWIVVRGEAGVGKTALLREFAVSVAEGASQPTGSEPLVLHGRCYERELVPYKALDSAIDELSHVLRALPTDHALRREEVDRAGLLSVFPVLGRVPWLRADGTPELHEAHPMSLRERGFAALRLLLASLAAEQPLVLCIDDVQWSDADSGRLLAELLCEERSPRLLVVASDRGSVHSTNPAIDEFQRASELAPRPRAIEYLELQPLRADDAVRLAKELLPSGAANSAEIAAESRGNPRVLADLARWVEHDAHAPSHTRRASSLDALIERRLRALGESSLLVLELVAASGRPIATSVIAAAAEQPNSCRAEIKELSDAGLLRAILRGSEELLELDDERVGEAVLSRLDAATRITRHLSLVQAINRKREDATEALIDQYAWAGMPLSAASCARRAGALALSSHAFMRAARLFERAIALGDWAGPERAELHRDHALTLELSGQGLDAAAAYERAAALTSEPLLAAELEQRAADHLMRNGRYHEGAARLARTYAALGLRWPRTRFALALTIAWHLLPSRLRRLMQRRASEPVLRARAELLADALRGIETVDVLRAMHNVLACSDAAEQLPDRLWRHRVSGARALLKCFALLPGGMARGLAQLTRACEDAAALGDTLGEARLRRQLAVSLYFAGYPRGALEAAKQSASCFRRVPEGLVEIHAVESLIGSALFDLGELRQAAQRWHALTHAVRLHHDVMTISWVHAHPGRLGVLFAYDERVRCEAILEQSGRARAAYPGYPYVGWLHATGRVEHALYWGTDEEAWQIAVREERTLLGVQPSVLGMTGRVARARAFLRAAAARAPGPPRAALLRQVKIDAAVLRAGANPWNRGLSELLRAALVWLSTSKLTSDSKRRERAIGHLRDAQHWFEVSEAKLLTHAAQYYTGALLAGTRGRELRAAALGVFEAEGIVDAPRYASWLACGFHGIVAADE